MPPPAALSEMDPRLHWAVENRRFVLIPVSSSEGLSTDDMADLLQLQARLSMESRRPLGLLFLPPAASSGLEARAPTESPL